MSAVFRGAEHRQKIAHGVSRGTTRGVEPAPDGAADSRPVPFGWERDLARVEARRKAGATTALRLGGSWSG